MEKDTLAETANALMQEWQLQLPGRLTEEAIIDLLAARLAAIIARSGEEFFQLMYRLDIPEKKLNMALQAADTAHAVARLVYNRQLQKIESRNAHRQAGNADTDPELKW